MSQESAASGEVERRPDASGSAQPKNRRFASGSGLGTLLPCCVIAGAALAVGLFRVNGSGTLWPDGPRYANGAAMIEGWFLSGDWLHPYAFATRDYARYPAFSIPYHPPLFPALLGLSFLAGGQSWVTARVFMAGALGLAGCCFYGISRSFGISKVAALGSALLLVTTPQVARWSRDTMSEVPSLTVSLAASWVFLLWLRGARPWAAWASFGLALAAFLCRVTTAGIIPGWFLFGVWTGRRSKLLSTHLILAALLYLTCCAGYVRLVSQFNRYEVTADGKFGPPTLKNLAYFRDCVPHVLPRTTVLAMAAGVACAAVVRRDESARFWGSWLISYSLFKVAMPTSPEVRHFFQAIPAAAGLAACMFQVGFPGWWRKGVAPLVIAGALASNALALPRLPTGVVGYGPVARVLARGALGGNVFLACPHDQDLIFRYRCEPSRFERAMIRADRTLAVKVSGYAQVPDRLLAKSSADVLDHVRRGRVRYLVVSPTLNRGGDYETEELALVLSVIRSNPHLFRQVGEYPLSIQFEGPVEVLTVGVWEYTGEVLPGPSELRVIVPTAGLEIPPQ